jgi:choline transporter-like protein 2/4/5
LQVKWLIPSLPPSHRAQDNNRAQKISFKALKCCMWCVEKVMKFISKNAFIVVAMKGKSFCGCVK